MSWYRFRPYIPVAVRRRQAEQTARKLAAKGRSLAPVILEGSAISRTFWGKAWCDNLESYSDYENRLPRGRTYVRNGSVIDLQLGSGSIEALVQGSELYKVAIGIGALAPKRWKQFTLVCSGKITNLLDLLQGRLSKDILAGITAQGSGLFPSPKEIKLSCSCPDWADMCKHVAAVLYGVGSRLDESPELFFTLRAVAMEDLIASAGASAAEPFSTAGAGALEGEDLEALFGVEIETGSLAKTKPAQKKSRSRRAGKPAAKKARPAKGPVKAKGTMAEIAPAKKRGGAVAGSVGGKKQRAAAKGGPIAAGKARKRSGAAAKRPAKKSGAGVTRKKGPASRRRRD